MATISAKLIADGVGLPPFSRIYWKTKLGQGAAGWNFMHSDGKNHQIWDDDDYPTPWDVVHVDLTNSQTAFGVALRLDDWEQSGGRVSNWTFRYGAQPPPAKVLAGKMLARITHIGQDHAIRRALGWEVEPGTLATLEPMTHHRWRFSASANTYVCAGAYACGLPVLPALKDIAYPAEALAAIHAGVCNG